MERFRNVRALTRNVGLYLSDLGSTLASLEKTERLKPPGKIVFIDQFQGASPNLIEREYGPIGDSAAAKRFGARNLKEFSFWAWRACGIANVASILASEDKLEDKKLFDLIQIGLRKNGYAHKNRWGREDVGWKHRSLAEILSDHGLKAKHRPTLGLKALLAEMNRSRYIIASVISPTGSHLVLLKEFTPEINGDGEVTYNDPYLFEEKGGENLTMSLKDWSRHYLGAAITTC